MEIRKIETNKENFIDLLLLGDEQENMINKYLQRGELYALYDNDDLTTVCVVTQEDEITYEIKNLATYEKYQGKGYGKMMMNYIIENLKSKCNTLLVGTGDIEKAIKYYESFGFKYSHRINNFFVDNYDHEMFEDGKQLIDMVYLRMDFKKD